MKVAGVKVPAHVVNEIAECAHMLEKFIEDYDAITGRVIGALFAVDQYLPDPGPEEAYWDETGMTDLYDKLMKLMDDREYAERKNALARVQERYRPEWLQPLPGAART